ncbi:MULTISPECIES: hypothetical protein [Stenotrophomonas]|uniref:hypothetical protein n=1 Tax=Stenotrophomonas maltophilia group TaxID=995085 RepID=UPI0021C83DFD|nr:MULTISPECIES: hypothetical protein [Stenotrophomonas]MCU1136878.1 hypothetical protein [Stenotrophomonas maltophilia]MEC4339796.1 hypothetical protein [Stenotrophomonas pavanii]
MDSQFIQPEVILVHRSLADSVALSQDESSFGTGATMTLADMEGLQMEELELIPVRLVDDDCHADTADPSRELSAARDAHHRDRARADHEIRDLKRLLALAAAALAAAALEPHISAAGDEARIYTSIVKKLGLATPIIGHPGLT